MPDGTVNGAFRLSTGEARREVRSYITVAKQADGVTKKLGASIDEAFGRKRIAKIKEVEKATNAYGRSTTRVLARSKADWKGAARDIERSGGRILVVLREIQSRTDALGRARPSIKVDIDTASANAQITALERRLQRLDRMRASPNVGVGGAMSGGGGSGGGGGRGRGIGIGRVRGPAAFAAVGLGLPAVQAAAGGVTALAASMSGAALGAGAVGVAGGGIVASGLISIITVAKPAAAALKAATKAQDDYTKAVQQYGVGSAQAKRAHDVLDQAFANQPGLKRATRELRAYHREWKALSAPGRQSILGLVGDAAVTGRKTAGQTARNSNAAARAARGAGDSQLNMFASQRTQSNLSMFTRTFVRELPIAERTLQNLENTTMNFMRASIPYLHEFDVWVEKTTGGWAAQTRNVTETRAKVGGLVDETKKWGRLLGSVGGLVKTVFGGSRSAGDGLVTSLTGTIDGWNDSLKKNPNQLRDYFDRSAESVRHLASALASVVSALDKIATKLQPLLTGFGTLVSGAGSLGLMTPGAGALAFGAFRGARGGGGGTAAAAIGGAAAVGGARAAGRVGIGATARTAYTGARGVGAGRLASLGAGGALGGQVLGGRAGAAAAGAGKAFLPIAAILSALSFAGTEGGFTDKAQGALSSATLGAISAPTTRAQRADASGRVTNSFLSRRVDSTNGRAIGAGGIAGRNTLAEGQRRAGVVGGEIDRLQTRLGARKRNEIGNANGVGIALDFNASGTTKAERRGLEARIALLKAEGEEIAKTNKEMAKQRTDRLNGMSQGRGYQFAGQIGGIYNQYRKTQGATQAGISTGGRIAGRISGSKAPGAEVAGEAGLSWAKAMAKENPALQSQVTRITSAIRARFAKLGMDISIVNGNILTGSKKEWAGISSAMLGETERARQGVQKDFTSIQQQAVGSLTSMGFSKSAASRLVQGIENGGNSAKMANQAIQIGGTTSGNGRTNAQNDSAMLAGRARGGTVPGSGLSDSVAMGGAKVAPGETWIANRHTMRELSSATLAKYGKTAEQMIGSESRRHSMPMIGGTGKYGMGGVGPSPASASKVRTGSRTGGLQAGISGIANQVLSAYPGLSITSTTGGNHVAGSYHYKGMAVDIGGPQGVMDTAARNIQSSMAGSLLEGIHNPGLAVKNGQVVNGPSVFSAVWAGHRDHIHLAAGGAGALGSAGQLAGGSGSASPAVGGGAISLSGGTAKQGGVAGALRSSASNAFAAGLQTKVNAAIGGGGAAAATAGVTTGGGTVGSNKQLGRQMLAASGMGGWSALETLWQGESGWNDKAVNPSSGAGGIPQALPASKMGPKGAGESPATQIGWGLNYIKGRYGSPDKALAAWQARSPHWYARGGQITNAGQFASGGSFTTNGPTMFMAGDGHSRKETVTVARSSKTIGKGTQGGGTGGGAIGELHVHLHGIGNVDDAEAERIARLVGEKLLVAMRAGTTGVMA